MTRLPSPRPVRLAQQICRLAGLSYMLIGAGVVGTLIFVPSVGSKLAGGPGMFELKDGVLTSTTLWWDGIINPIFHGLVFFVLGSALGYLADLGEALIERDYEANDAAEAAEASAMPPSNFGEIPELNPDDLQPLDR
jgi:hypothetical protein